MVKDDLKKIEKSILAGWISPLRELNKIIGTYKNDDGVMSDILSMTARIGEKDINAATGILSEIVHISAPGSSLEIKTVNQWRKTVENFATAKDIFNALSAAASGATLYAPGGALKKTAISTWKYLFDKAAAQNPDRALESARSALQWADVIRRTDAFGPESTNDFEDVVRHARDMLEIKTLLRRPGPSKG